MKECVRGLQVLKTFTFELHGLHTWKNLLETYPLVRMVWFIWNDRHVDVFKKEDYDTNCKATCYADKVLKVALKKNA